MEHTTKNNENSTSDICINCCSPFSNKNTKPDSHVDDNEEMSFNSSEIAFSKPTISNEITTVNSLHHESASKVSVYNALSSIFKLKYLNAFTQVPEKETEWSLCQECSDVFTNIYQLHRTFLRLSNVDSLLQSKIRKLDDIIYRHEQKIIFCDLIVSPQQQESNIQNKNSQLKTRISILEPRIILTRLPVQSESQPFENEDFDFDDIQNDLDDPSYDPLDDFGSVEIKTEPMDFDESPEFLQNEPNLPASHRNIFPNNKRKSKSRVASSQMVSRRSSRKSSAKPSTAIQDNPGKIQKSMKQAMSKIILSKTTSKKVPEVRKIPPKSGNNKNEAVIPDSIQKKTYRRRKTKFPNPCWYCKKHFPSPEECVEHTKKEHFPQNNTTAQICPRCSKICVNDSALRSHVGRCSLIPSGVVLESKFQCQECPSRFGTNHTLRVHMLVHSNDRPFPCDQCPYKAKTALTLNQHKNNMHEKLDPLTCEECGSVLKSLAMYRQHKKFMHSEEGRVKYREKQRKRTEREQRKKQETGPPPTVCPDCNVDFFSHFGMIMHRKSSHMDKIESRYVCELCGKNFSSSTSLKTHLGRVHSDERPYLCGQCGSTFKSTANLKKHETNTHTEEGRIKFNEYMRQRNQRKKLLQTQLLSHHYSQNFNVRDDSQ